MYRSLMIIILATGFCIGADATQKLGEIRKLKDALGQYVVRAHNAGSESGDDDFAALLVSSGSLETQLTWWITSGNMLAKIKESEREPGLMKDIREAMRGTKIYVSFVKQVADIQTVNNMSPGKRELAKGISDLLIELKKELAVSD
jgi:hypothetical protein